MSSGWVLIARTLPVLQSKPHFSVDKRFDRASAIARRIFCLGAVLVLAGCAGSPPARYARDGLGGYDPRLGVRASPKLIADGEPIPRGGGTYLVGRPYTVAGRTYYPSERPYKAVGTASWYGDAFQGRRTANGEIFDKNAIAAAHPTMPLPSYARITNLRNDRSLIVRVNDRGPYAAGRVMDVSERVADVLDFRSRGTTQVRVEYVGRASLDGSDDEKLIATLRTDGSVASLEGSEDALTFPVADEAPAPVAPRRALAVAAPEPAAPAPVLVAQAANDGNSGDVPVDAPLPPSRPFNLGAGKAGMTMAALAFVPRPQSAQESDPAVPLPVRRPGRPAALNYTSAGIVTETFERGDPFAGLTPQAFVPLRGPNRTE
ncbi:MAG: septal ring lytic transglycosylase RlpA family protein [Methylobacteriaceae bacterium]|nr:septal ring lytic transglycosylase RlpA family protein [Methylobacteriaceae bacterium]